MLDLIADPSVDFRQSVVLRAGIPSTLVPAKRSRVSIIDNALVFEGESDETSMVVLPFEFSHCLVVEGLDDHRGPMPRLTRANLHQIGLVFEGEAHVRIRFRYRPVVEVRCRMQDNMDFKELKISDLVTYRGAKIFGGRVH